MAAWADEENCTLGDDESQLPVTSLLKPFAGQGPAKGFFVMAYSLSRSSRGGGAVIVP